MISALLIPNYADRRGRKNVVFATSSGAILVSLGLIFSRSLSFSCCVIFVLGLLVSGNFSVSFVYNMEFFPPEWQSTIGTFDNIMHAVLWGVEPLYFLYVSKNYVWLMAIGASANMLAILGFIFFLEESPCYLYSRR
jgi:MFS family permease